MRLALRLEIPFFDLLDFREWVAMSRYMDALRRNLLDEISSSVREVCAKSTPPKGAGLWQIEERLDWLFRALCLEVPANEAEVADLTLGRFTEIVEALLALAGQPLSGDMRAQLKNLDQMLGTADEFLRLSWERGSLMATRTLDKLEELGEDRALLVAGGFHTRAITQTLERTADVSWSVVAPSPDLSELGGKRRLIG